MIGMSGRAGKRIQPDIRERLEAIGLDPETKAPSEFSAFIRKETELWSRIIRQAGIQVE